MLKQNHNYFRAGSEYDVFGLGATTRKNEQKNKHFRRRHGEDLLYQRGTTLKIRFWVKKPMGENETNGKRRGWDAGGRGRFIKSTSIRWTLGKTENTVVLMWGSKKKC